MQSFLPYSSFERSARVLDRKRLGKQIIEARQIGNAAVNPRNGWAHHPAARSWRGHVGALIRYAWQCDREWRRRGFAPHLAFRNMLLDHPALDGVWPWPDLAPAPPWVGDERLHASMRAALLAKDPEWYGQFGWTERPVVAYDWPDRRDDDEGPGARPGPSQEPTMTLDAEGSGMALTAHYYLRPLPDDQLRAFLERHAPLCGARAGRRVCTRPAGHWQSDVHYDLRALVSFSSRDPGANGRLAVPPSRVEVEDLVGDPL